MCWCDQKSLFLSKKLGKIDESYNSPLNALSSTDGNNADNSSPVADCNSRSDIIPLWDADATAVRTLYERLVADGVDAWLDKEKLISRKRLWPKSSSPIPEKTSYLLNN